MFKKLILLLLVIFSIQGVYAKESYPQDISSFIEKREQCDYFRGEISGEPNIDNARNINEELDKYCKGTDQLLETLKLKYKDDNSIQKKLNTYELIECKYNCRDNSEEMTIRLKFSDYPVTEVVNNNTSKHTATFAGHYHISIYGCGGGSICGEIIDSNTGKFVTSFPNPYLTEDENQENNFDLNYQLDSTLFIISGITGDTETDANNNVLEHVYRIRYYNFLNGELNLISYDEKPAFKY
ncbi:hypothetical protein [uncultured Gilliamella sp.]|jgi:hypothetical protein|uniref:hypothetical protein n=1 Tax=uncultured Gilliamella sp. TaxID=1193505 RepID=UPI0025D47D9A|nr:hypothetical protein [uncultured Gilliamella sp.]